MSLKPVNIDYQSILNQLVWLVIGGAITALLALGNLDGIKNFIAPSNGDIDLLHLLILMVIPVFYSIFFTFLYINYHWRKDLDNYDAEYQNVKHDRDNLLVLYGESERHRLTDLITGVPNRVCLEREIEKKFSKMDGKKHLIFIDLKSFSEINKKYGQHRANLLLREIAQTIYKTMRRNEEMYKCPIGNSKSTIYRIYPGGDEFAFVIFGDQSEAIGFSNRLVGMFKQISDKTASILGSRENLSFHCAIIEMFRGDSYSDIEQKIDPSSMNASIGKKAFTIYWESSEIEKHLLSDKENNEKKLIEYRRARDLFEVMTPP